MIGWLVDNMHVGTPESEVVKDFYRRFKRWGLDQPGAEKDNRKYIYRKALERHRANRQLCIDFRL